MVNTPSISILYVVIASMLGAAGQFLFKSAADQLQGGIIAFLVNPRIILGLGCYLTVMALFVHAFQKGGSVTVLYPIYASTFIWAAIIAQVAYNQPIKPINIGGMVLLMIGMALMGK